MAAWSRLLRDNSLAACWKPPASALASCRRLPEESLEMESSKSMRARWVSRARPVRSWFTGVIIEYGCKCPRTARGPSRNSRLKY